MSTQLLVDGVWPGPLRISRGWARGEARRWNDEGEAGHLRLVRGGPEFLGQATAAVGSMSGGTVYSPALYPERTNMWRDVGYSNIDTLLVLERPTATPTPPPRPGVTVGGDPNWDSLVQVDRSAFSNFWRLGRHGIEEAYMATPTAVVLTYVVEGVDAGYAIFGVQRLTAFLQRIAVRPEMQGQGVGTALIRTGLGWSRAVGARSVLLNVLSSSERALNIYLAEGFHDSGSRLDILGWHRNGTD